LLDPVITQLSSNTKKFNHL